MNIKQIIALIVGIAVLAGAAVFLGTRGGTPTPTNPSSEVSMRAEFNKEFTLRVGGSAGFSDGLSVNLISMADSRCKPNVQCVWQGELGPILAVSGGGYKQENGSIRLGTVTAQEVIRSGYSFAVRSATKSTATLVVQTVPVTKNPSGISGYVHVGPTCPVMRIPPDPDCGDQPFSGALLTVRSAGTDSVVKQGRADVAGEFSIMLESGTYTITAEPRSGSMLPRCNVQTVTITPNEFTFGTDISCDSGIR